jgi:hypothetical protein
MEKKRSRKRWIVVSWAEKAVCRFRSGLFRGLGWGEVSRDLRVASSRRRVVWRWWALRISVGVQR